MALLIHGIDVAKLKREHEAMRVALKNIAQGSEFWGSQAYAYGVLRELDLWVGQTDFDNEARYNAVYK